VPLSLTINRLAAIGEQLIEWRNGLWFVGAEGVNGLPNDRWLLDFVADQFIDGPRMRILIVVDDCTRECLALVADTSISINPKQPLVIHDEILPAQRHQEPAIAEASSRMGKSLQPLAQLGIRRSTRAIAHRHPHTADHPARPPLAHEHRHT